MLLKLARRLFSTPMTDATSANSTRPIYSSMMQKIQSHFSPIQIQIDDESPQHAGHAAMKNYPISETHFSAFIVSELFRGQTPIKRHRQVYQLLDDEFKQGLHALRLETLTPEEYQKKYNL